AQRIAGPELGDHPRTAPPAGLVPGHQVAQPDGVAVPRRLRVAATAAEDGRHAGNERRQPIEELRNLQSMRRAGHSPGKRSLMTDILSTCVAGPVFATVGRKADDGSDEARRPT